jgi:hypothetical protein
MRSRSGPGLPALVNRRIREKGKTWSTATGSVGAMGLAQIRQRWCWTPINAGQLEAVPSPVHGCGPQGSGLIALSYLSPLEFEQHHLMQVKLSLVA